MKLLGGGSGGLDRRRKGKERLGPMEAQYVFGLKLGQGESGKAVGVRSVSLKSSVVGCKES